MKMMKFRIEIEPLADHFVVAAKDWKTGELKETFTLNESGVDMLRLFCQGKDVDSISHEMSEMYDAPMEVISKDVRTFADRLVKKGFM